MSYSRLVKLLPVLAIVLVQACSSTPEKGPQTEEAREKLINTYVSAAGIYMQQGQLQFAKEKIDKALALDDDDVNANNVLGLFYWRTKEFDKAEKAFKKALRRDSKDPDTLHNYGFFLCEQKRYKESLVEFDKAIANPLFPAHKKASSNVSAGTCAMRIKEYAKAEQYYRAALALNPKEPVALRVMGKISARNGKLMSARAFMQRYFRVAKPTSSTIYLAMRVEEALDSPKSAALLARKLLKEFPDSKEADWVKRRKQKHKRKSKKR